MLFTISLEFNLELKTHRISLGWDFFFQVSNRFVQHRIFFPIESHNVAVAVSCIDTLACRHTKLCHLSSKRFCVHCKNLGRRVMGRAPLLWPYTRPEVKQLMYTRNNFELQNNSQDKSQKERSLSPLSRLGKINCVLQNPSVSPTGLGSPRIFLFIPFYSVTIILFLLGL